MNVADIESLAGEIKALVTRIALFALALAEKLMMPARVADALVASASAAASSNADE